MKRIVITVHCDVCVEKILEMLREYGERVGISGARFKDHFEVRVEG